MDLIAFKMNSDPNGWDNFNFQGFFLGVLGWHHKVMINDLINEII